MLFMLFMLFDPTQADRDFFYLDVVCAIIPPALPPPPHLQSRNTIVKKTTWRVRTKEALPTEAFNQAKAMLLTIHPPPKESSLVVTCFVHMQPWKGKFQKWSGGGGRSCGGGGLGIAHLYMYCMYLYCHVYSFLAEHNYSVWQKSV